MSTQEPNLARYLAGMDNIEGWVQSGAVTSTILLSAIQQHLGVIGGVGEIGIHHGKFFLLLCHLRKPSEAGLAIDVFEQQELNIDHSGKGDRRIFEENVCRYFPAPSNIEIFQADSLALRPAALAATSLNKYRLFSIDGGHTVAHIMNDLRLVEPVLHAQGIVIVDDLFHWDWPGVTEGMFRYWSDGGALRPFALGDGKLFCAHRDRCDEFYELSRRMLHPFAKQVKIVEIVGRQCVSVSMRPPSEVVLEDGKALSSLLNFSSDGEGAVFLGTGWSTPEQYGTWTICRDATVNMPLYKAESSNAASVTVRVVGFPFIPPDRGRQGVRLRLNGRELGQIEAEESDLAVLQAEVPRSAISPTNNVLTFEVDSPAAPSDFNLAADERRLGFHLVSIYLFERP